MLTGLSVMTNSAGDPGLHSTVPTIGGSSAEASAAAAGSAQRYDLKLWMGSGDGSAAYLPDDKSWKRRRGERRRGRNAAC
jgi:hypothetical protein